MKLTLPFDHGHDDLQPPATLTARDWFLFTDAQDAAAARELSAAASAAMAAPTRDAAERIAWDAMVKWAEVGACDTEPRNLMMAYLDSAFGPRPPQQLDADAKAELEAWVEAVFGTFLRSGRHVH